MIQLTDNSESYIGRMTEGNYILYNGNILTISKITKSAGIFFSQKITLKILNKDDLSIIFNKDITLPNSFSGYKRIAFKTFIKNNRIYFSISYSSAYNNGGGNYSERNNFNCYVFDYSLNILGSTTLTNLVETPGKNFIISRSISSLPSGSINMFCGAHRFQFVNDTVAHYVESDTYITTLLTNDKTCFFECHGDTYSSNTVGQYLNVDGSRTQSAQGLFLLYSTSGGALFQQLTYTSIVPYIVGNARNVCIVKGYNGKTFIIYKTTGNGVRYKEWNTLTNTLGTEYTLVNDGLLSENLILSDTTKFVSQIKINTTQILVSITTKDGFTQTVLSQNPSTNLLTVFKNDINLAGFSEIGDRNTFIGFGQKIGRLSNNAANTISYIDTVSFSMGGNEVVGQNILIKQNGSCGIIYDYAPDILKGQLEYTCSSENKIYHSKIEDNDPEIFYEFYDSFLQIINFNDPVYQNSYFESINFDTTGMKSFKFEATQSVPTGCSIEWFYSVNNGGSFSSLTNGGTVSAVGNSLKLKAVLNTEGQNSVKINSYKVTVYK